MQTLIPQLIARDPLTHYKIHIPPQTNLNFLVHHYLKMLMGQWPTLSTEHSLTIHYSSINLLKFTSGLMLVSVPLTTVVTETSKYFKLV
jgi:hypothetical protein